MFNYNLKRCAAILGLSALMGASATADVTLDIDAGRRGPKIGELHYGIFFEEINHAGDGGIYAELIRNRSFEDSNSADHWSKIGNASYSLETTGLINDIQKKALRLTLSASGDGIANAGFWGMNAVAGNKYSLSFWVKSDAGFDGNLQASLVGADGKSLGAVAIPVKADKTWRKVSAEITATGSDGKATFQLTGDKAGTLSLDMVSLFPPTYKNRENGCRQDLVEMLAAMKPAFVRFPGGCFVEGTNRDGSHNRFEWKKTLGGIETRPGHYNVNWDYPVSDGLGFHEMLLLTEDLGAEPLFVVNIGMGHGWTVDYREIDEYIQEALDAIEYCNGDVTTKWGKMRADAGHPEPFNLRLIEIGNENYQADANQQSDHYAERYKAFYDAIKAKYPDMILIGNVESWGTDNPSWRNNYPVEVVDEHYYRNPDWFINQYSKYDSYDRSKYKVYAGEYAVTSDFGNTGHIRAALGEAVYMLGMENNSDICVMNSYAPIFVNENDQKWKPDMIRFGSDYSFGTPSYYVQQLFPNYVGKQNVKFTETGNINGMGDKVGLSTWSTTATFDNLKVTGADGSTIVLTDDFASASGKWSSEGGSWNVANGVLTQSDSGMQGKKYVNSTACGSKYTFEVDATKTGGAEGFLIVFNYQDANNYCWWNIGGWNNAAHAIEVCKNGSKTEVGRVAGSLTNNKAYRLKVEVDGDKVKCYMDGELVHDVTLPVSRELYFSSNIDDDNEVLYVKVVNPNGNTVKLDMNLANARLAGVEKAVVMSAASGTAENTHESQLNVAPRDAAVSVSGDSKASYTVPAYSMTIFKFNVSDINLAGGEGSVPSEEMAKALREELEPLSRRLAFLHSTAGLPTSSRSGDLLTWRLEGDADGMLSVDNTLWSATLTVNPARTNTSDITGASLVADVIYSNGAKGSLSFPVTLAALDPWYGYLYCYMKSTYETTNFALGTKEDKGMKFNQLLNGDEIFDTNAVAGIEHGTRDAYLLRGERDGEYFMTTTDMCNRISGKWNNYGLDLIRSKDLVHWESTTFDFRQGKKIFSDPEATTDAYKTDAEYANITRVWAPQAIWDPKGLDGQGGYLVYYSLLSSNAGDNHDRIYYSYADKDFKTLTQPRVFYDPGYSVIDADINYNPYDGLYHMGIKREGAANGQRGIYELTSPDLVGGEWKEVLHITAEGNALCEGSSKIRRIDEDAWNLYYMRYTDGNTGYKYVELDHLGVNPTGPQFLQGEGNFQHGSFVYLNEEEYKMLEAYDELYKLIPVVKGYGSPLFDAPVKQAEDAMALTSVAELAKALPEAIAAIKSKREEYIKSLAGGDEAADLTILLANPSFDNNVKTGWSGTAWGAVREECAEHYNRTFDTYQVLEQMPAGEYRLACNGFYRNGNKSAYNAHVDGSEELLAELYINDVAVPLMSLYDQSGYTGDPYTFPNDMTTFSKAVKERNEFYNEGVVFNLQKSGDLRLGLRKSKAKSEDWTIADNFKLFYNPLPRGVECMETVDADAPVDVYTADGVMVRHNVAAAAATQGLPKGLYIIGTRKVIVK